MFFCSVGFKFYPLGEQQNSKNSTKEKEARRNPFPSSVIVVSTSRERRSRSSAIRISRKRGKRERRGARAERRREGLLARRQRARPAPVGGRAIRFRRKKKGPRHYITAVLSSLELNALTTTPCNWQREKGAEFPANPIPLLVQWNILLEREIRFRPSISTFALLVEIYPSYSAKRGGGLRSKAVVSMEMFSMDVLDGIYAEWTRDIVHRTAI